MTPLAANAADGGGGGTGGSGGGTAGNFAMHYIGFDQMTPGTTTPVQGYMENSIQWFFNNSGNPGDTTGSPNAQEYMTTACNVALANAESRRSPGTPAGTSRVMWMGWATDKDHLWGRGEVTPMQLATMYSDWVNTGRQGVLAGLPDQQGYYNMIQKGWNEGYSQLPADSATAVCIALNADEPPMNYQLSVTTDKTNPFTVAGGTDAVTDTIHASNNGSSTAENVNADVILHWTGTDGTAKQVTKTTAIANNGDTVSPGFVPADLGMDVWQGGTYWFDVQVSKQGHMSAGVDTPDQDPRETWTAWLPVPDKEVIGSGEQSGDHTGANINGMSVFPGQKLEYKIGVDLRVTDGVAPTIKTFAVKDAYDAQFAPDQSSIQFLDSRDPSKTAVVPRSAYTLAWDDAAHTVTATFTDAWVKANIANNTTKGWLTMRLTGTVKPTTAPGSVVANQAFQIVNGISTKTEIPTVNIPNVTPHKEDLNTDLVDINGKTVVKGDHILYRLTLDASVKSSQLAYNVHKLGMTDDFDEEYLDLAASGVKITNKATGEDVTAKFNIQVKDGVMYAFAKQVDSVNQNGVAIPGDPQPTDLKAYDAAAIDPSNSPIIDQALMGNQYFITLDTVVKKVTDGYVIKNQAVQNLENSHKPTEIVSNPLKDINPHKDVVVSPATGGTSIDGSEVKLNATFNYRLDTSVIPANRAYNAKDWSLVDTFDRAHDQYTGTWAVYANSDLYNGQTLVVKKGDLIDNSAGTGPAALKGAFTSAWDEASYTATFTATSKYLDLVNTRGDLPQAWSVYTQMIRIAPADRVDNKTTETYNSEQRDSNVVWTKTPENPAITLIKYTLSQGQKPGDHNTKDDADQLDADGVKNGVKVGFHITNTGDVPLKNVVLTDLTNQGLTGTVDGITCADGAVSPSSIGELTVGQSIDCVGTLHGMSADKLHGDTATVTGESKYTGKKVTATDPWFAKAPGALAATGGSLASPIAITAGVVALLGGGLLAVFGLRRRKAAALAAAGADVKHRSTFTGPNDTPDGV